MLHRKCDTKRDQGVVSGWRFSRTKYMSSRVENSSLAGKDLEGFSMEADRQIHHKYRALGMLDFRA